MNLCQIVEDYSVEVSLPKEEKITQAASLDIIHEYEASQLKDQERLEPSEYSQKSELTIVAPAAFKKSSLEKYVNDLLALHKETLRVVESDPRYKYLKPYLEKAIRVEAEIRLLIKEDPRYVYLKPQIEASLSVLKVAMLIVSLGTLNPIAILTSLYSLT